MDLISESHGVFQAISGSELWTYVSVNQFSPWMVGPGEHNWMTLLLSGQGLTMLTNLAVFRKHWLLGWPLLGVDAAVLGLGPFCT